MYISLVMLILLILCILIFSRDKDPFFKKLDSKEHPLRVIYPLASRIYGLLVKNGRQDMFGNTDVLREIYVDEKPEISQKKQACKCIASVLAVLAVTLFICFAYSYSKESLLIEKTRLKRNQAGGGTKKYGLVLNSDITDKNLIEVSVSEQKLQGEELEKLKADAGYYLNKKVMDKNKSADCVREKLNLITEIPGTAVTVKWSQENSWFISTDGSLKNDDFIEPVPVTLHAELTYYEEVWDYELDMVIYPPYLTEEEKLLESLDAKLSEIDSETQTEEMFDLPQELDGVEIKWSEEEDSTSRNFFLLGLLAAVVIFPSMKKDVKKKQKERYDQMMRDYPDIISKFIMLITAGMTCRAAWNKICRDYQASQQRDNERKDRSQKKKGKDRNGSGIKRIRYAYEEMIISNNEMELGMPEIKVYERFGTRCSVPAYNRFGNMLARNIKRGSSSIIELLESEAKESFAERRENVRQRGEETGTKLLIPMFGMLILAIAIVVVPAFSSFSF